MSEAVQLRGVYAPLATLVNRHGEVEPEDMRRQIDAIRGWTDGLMPAIGCGEGLHLDDDQWHAVLASVVESSGELPVHMGAQAQTWELARQRANAAMAAGADGVVVGLPPAQSQAPITEILRKCEVIARDCSGPMVFYWEKFLSSRRLSGKEASAVCSALGARSVKDSMRDPALTAEFRECADGVTVLEGWEDRLLPDQPLDGYIGPLALLSSAPSTLFTDAPEWARCLREAHEYRVLEPGYVAQVKQVLEDRGIASYSGLISSI